MPNVAVRSSTKAGGTGTSISVSEPAGAAVGDLILCFVGSNGSLNIRDNNGSTPFTEDYTLDPGTPSITVSIFSRIKVSGDPTSYNFDWSSGSRRAGIVCLAFSDPHTTIYDVTPDTTTDRLQTTNAATADDVDILTVIANSIHVSCLWIDRAAVPSSYDGTGYTEEEDQNASSSQSINVQTKIITTPAQTGQNTFSMDTNSTAIAQSFSVANNSGGGGAATPHNPFGLPFNGPFGGPIS